MSARLDFGSTFGLGLASFLAGLLLSACPTSNDDGDADCAPGQSGCECTADGLCDPGLMCSDNACVPVGETSDSDGGTETDASDTDTGTGDGDPSTDCHPLMIDCPQVGTTCTWTGAEFLCTQGEIAIGDSCVPDDPVCISGFCAPMAMVPGCPSTHCCAAFCDLNAPNCFAAGTTCVDYFPDGATSPEVGACLGM